MQNTFIEGVKVRAIKDLVVAVGSEDYVVAVYTEGVVRRVKPGGYIIVVDFADLIFGVECKENEIEILHEPKQIAVEEVLEHRANSWYLYESATLMQGTLRFEMTLNGVHRVSVKYSGITVNQYVGFSLERAIAKYNAIIIADVVTRAKIDSETVKPYARDIDGAQIFEGDTVVFADEGLNRYVCVEIKHLQHYLTSEPLRGGPLHLRLEGMASEDGSMYNVSPSLVRKVCN